eukprot:5729652-Pleurochrysis_carterae.AAC.1
MRTGISPKGTYYEGLGIDTYIDETGSRVQQPFDLYVKNSSIYVPKNPEQNGKRSGLGDFGIINANQNQKFIVEYILVEPETGNRYAPKNGFAIWFLDIDTGTDGVLQESFE